MLQKIFIFAFVFIYQLSFANEPVTIKGKVTNKSIGIPGVSVYVKHSKEGTSTNIDGEFVLMVKPVKHQIIISAIGFKTKELTVDLSINKLIDLNLEMVEDVFGLEQVVISATKTHLNRKEAPVLVTVTNMQLLESTKATSLIDALSFQPGLRTENNCQTCGFTQVRINGLEGAYSQILINSKPIFSSLNGIYGLEQIPANMIQQIEIIRGGGSALFGANAIAGTINVITKDPIENSFQVSSTLSSINRKSNDATISFNSTFIAENLNKGITFFGMYRNREAYDHNQDTFSEITQLKGVNFGLKSFYKIQERKKLTADFNVSNDLRRGGNMFDKPAHFADIAEEINTDIVGGSLNFDYFTKNYLNKFSIYTNLQKTNSANYYGTEQDPFGYGSTNDLTQLLGGQHTVKFEETWGESLELTSGFEYKYNTISEKRENIIANDILQTIETIGIFTQMDWKLTPKLKLLTGLRQEFFKSNLRNENLFVLNPRMSVLYNLTEKISLRTSYANGFRAPQFFSDDIHAEIITGEVRNVILSEDLKPEKSDSFMASAEYNHTIDDSQLIVTLEGFYTQLNKPFIYENRGNINGFAIKEKINGEMAYVKGLNVEFKYTPNNNLLVQLGATVQQGKYSQTYTPEVGISTKTFLRTPNIYGNAILNYTFSKNWKINLNSVFTGSMKVPHLAGYITETRLEKTPKMIEVGINISHKHTISKDLQAEFIGGVKNIFNSYQKDFDKSMLRDSGYIYGPSQPQTFFIGLKFGSNLL